MNRRKTFARRTAVFASCAALALSGCAGDSREGDEAAAPEITQTLTPSDSELITAAAVELATTDDLTRKCEQLATSGFVLAVFGSQENCKTSDSDADSGDDATGAKVSGVMVEGATATAVVTLEGGDTAGATGAWRFAKDPGGGWRLSEWSIDYLRSVLATGFGPNYRADDENDPFAEADTRECFTAKLQSLDDQSFRTVVYSLVANRDDSNELLGQALIDCGYTDFGSELDAADSEVRASFEASYRASASQARPGADLDCELEALRESVTDAEIEAAGTDSGAYNAIATAAAEAQKNCAGDGKSA